MTESKLPHSDYVQKVRDDTQRYIRELLAESDRLRKMAEEASSEAHRLGEENRELAERLRGKEEELGRYLAERQRLEEKLSLTTRERERFLHDFVDLEQRNNDLANLYVATYRLHGTVDELEVMTAIEEIVINLIGCEQFGLFDLDGVAGKLRLVRSMSLPEQVGESLDGTGGLVGRALETGVVMLGSATEPSPLPNERGLTACVPIKVGSQVFGALLLFDLLPQKRGRLAPVDAELLELLASQAGTALYASRAVSHGANVAGSSE